MEDIFLSFDPDTNSGIFRTSVAGESSVWQRLTSAALTKEASSASIAGRLQLTWYHCLNLFREFEKLQRSLNFRFRSDDTSRDRLYQFLTELRLTEAARSGSVSQRTSEEVHLQLQERGFTRRSLRDFQVRDIVRLSSIPSGANFSVPGAGKTTVTLALHVLTAGLDDKMLVICPKSAFPAWYEIIAACIDPSAGSFFSLGEFVNLSGLDAHRVTQLMSTNYKYFVTNYEHFVAHKDIFSFEISRRPTHLILDESHRMKAGLLSQRGSALLNIANLPKRKDILTGTPMPQGPADLQSQLDFLWPGSGLGTRISLGEPPRTVISGLYARTTKLELGLPPIIRQFHQIPMSEPQAALYGIVTNEVLKQLSTFRENGVVDIIKARRSVMRLLQLASNPILALRAITDDFQLNESGIVKALLNEPSSPKMLAAARIARANASIERKTVIWTIFTQNITDLEAELPELNPVSLYGNVPTGDVRDEATREGRLRRFHEDPYCKLMIANPAAAGEGISLHKVCHEAIYLDRSYISTHYLQSIDRIHRLGLSHDQITNVNILQAAPPAGLGSIDFSVSRRLASKIRALQQLLEDPDLHTVAFDEENATEPIDYSLDLNDVIDLIEELEGRSFYNSDSVI